MMGRYGWSRWFAWLVSALLVGVGAFTAAGAHAAPPPTAPGNVHDAGHPYRHGEVPTHGANAAGTATTSSANLYYHGGTNGVGVTSGGSPKVYLVFWGSQWGTQSTNAAQNVTLSGDRYGLAPDLEAFFKGLGSNGELWSGVLTQYCDGSVAVNSQTCASGAAQVAYPTGASGAFGGVWVDERASAPSQATAAQLANEAMSAAGQFGLTSANSRDAQVFVVSPSGTHPDGFNTIGANWCAWHDHTADPSIGSSATWDLAFTNMPYLLDMGTSCGENFVNAGGTLDGVTIVGGHEYAETLTDQFPDSDSAGNITTGGWADSSSSENGDKCAWIRSGQGASFNLSLATGTFAVQSTWGNDIAGCEDSHSIVTNATNGSLSFTNAAFAATAGAWTSVSVAASSGTPAITLSSSSPKGVFSANSGGPGASTLTLPAGTTTAYYEDTAAGAPTLTATASGYASGAQNETVTAGPLATITVTPGSVTLGEGATQTFTAAGADSYGNPVSVTPTWTATAGIGSVASGPSSSTTFTAGNNAASGSVTATSNTVSGAASVTVQAQTMKVTVAAGASSYNRKNGYKTPITTTATTGTGVALAGAAVGWAIHSASCTGTVVATTSTTTDSTGTSKVTFSTRTYGTYCAVATVSSTGYPTTSGQTTFTN